MLEEKIQRRFIEQQLDVHGEFLSDLFIEAIQSRELIYTGDMLDYFDNGSVWNVMSPNGISILQFPFPDYGRFIEINYQKRKNGLKSRTVDSTSLVYGLNNTKNKKKTGKNTQWYTKNVYGAQNRLIGRLMWGLSDQVRESIVEDFRREETINLTI